jgi:hypothetical protein
MSDDYHRGFQDGYVAAMEAARKELSRFSRPPDHDRVSDFARGNGHGVAMCQDAIEKISGVPDFSIHKMEPPPDAGGLVFRGGTRGDDWVVITDDADDVHFRRATWHDQEDDG